MYQGNKRYDSYKNIDYNCGFYCCELSPTFKLSKRG